MGPEADPETSWDDEDAGAARKRSRLVLGIGIGIGGALALSFTCVGGLVLLMVVGLGFMTSQVEDELRDNETLRERIGELEELELDWMRSFAADGDDVFVYRAEGTLGTGFVRAESVSQGDESERVVWAELELPSGELIELVEREE